MVFCFGSYGQTRSSSTYQTTCPSLWSPRSQLRYSHVCPPNGERPIIPSTTTRSLLLITHPRTFGKVEHPGSWSQVERDQELVLHHAAELRSEMIAQPGVVIEPPEGRPRKDDEAHSGPSQPLEFPDRCVVIRRRSPALPVTFEKRYGAASRGDLSSKLILVDE